MSRSWVEEAMCLAVRAEAERLRNFPTIDVALVSRHGGGSNIGTLRLSASHEDELEEFIDAYMKTTSHRDFVAFDSPDVPVYATGDGAECNMPIKFEKERLRDEFCDEEEWEGPHRAVLHRHEKPEWRRGGRRRGRRGRGSHRRTSRRRHRGCCCNGNRCLAALLVVLVIGLLLVLLIAFRIV
jgi:hypothetical protein